LVIGGLWLVIAAAAAATACQTDAPPEPTGIPELGGGINPCDQLSGTSFTEADAEQICEAITSIQQECANIGDYLMDRLINAPGADPLYPVTASEMVSVLGGQLWYPGATTEHSQGVRVIWINVESTHFPDELYQTLRHEYYHVMYEMGDATSDAENFGWDTVCEPL
jgi:hypothetical protein